MGRAIEPFRHPDRAKTEFAEMRADRRAVGCIRNQFDEYLCLREGVFGETDYCRDDCL